MEKRCNRKYSHYVLLSKLYYIKNIKSYIYFPKFFLRTLKLKWNITNAVQIW